MLPPSPLQPNYQFTIPSSGSSRTHGLGRSDLAVAQSDAGDNDDGEDEMTVFHFLNCAALTFGPHVVYYSATPL
ncbi:hypothetical protein E2562_014178 [Oryza meyeriana var. granulata]|uniref:Uncharacterized protein n=1 Tax=Oryza meyeriana var. granulata TaxID=110450 RepID=A0A6G1BKS8_9ORYZ|nr:hypothetical protein E2562_014178 [Oryza meyeriana var. granulata]